MLRPVLALSAVVIFLSAGAPRPAHKVKKAPCKTCTVNGPSCVLPGQAGIYTLSGGTTVGWTTSCGTIQHYNSTTVTVSFPTSGCSFADIETAGASCGGGGTTTIITSSCVTSGETPATPARKTH